MKKQYFWMIIVSLLVVIMVSCGTPVTEVPATNTPLPPTETATPIPPTATPTPTPVPYNLDVSVLDEEGDPVTVGNVSIAENLYPLGEDGVVSLSDLPGDSVALSINSPGYFPQEVTETIERGDNLVEVAMTADPFGLLPVNACAPGEKLVYIEDFQDGEAQEWKADESSLGGWVVEPDQNSPENIVFKASVGTKWTWLGGREAYSFDNVVWRLKMKIDQPGGQHLNFRFLENGQSNIRYIVSQGRDEINLSRLEFDNWVELGGNTRLTLGEWHLVEVSYYNDTVALYVDGKERITWVEPNPWKGGTLNIEPYVEDGSFYYDDFSVCELSAPFEPIPKPKTGFNLNATLVDSEGNPIVGAPVRVIELGQLDDATQVSDENGKVSWLDLPPGDTATLDLSVPGYFYQSETVDIIKGDTDTELILERDPNGMLASDACVPGETLVFVEDMQDGVMQGWNNLNAQIQAGVPNIGIIDEPESEGNMILAVQSPGPNAHIELGQYESREFSDAVWRMNIKSWKNMHFHLQWLNDNRDDVYIAFIYGQGENAGRLERFSSGVNFTVFTWNKRVGGDDQWHLVEISTFQGQYQLWIDGVLLGSWLDPEPIPSGYMGIGMDLWAEDSLAYFDNISVCDLNSPFVSVTTEE
jgi:hypothetical protein